MARQVQATMWVQCVCGCVRQRARCVPACSVFVGACANGCAVCLRALYADVHCVPACAVRACALCAWPDACLNPVQTNLIKEAIRRGQEELGEFFYQRGDLQVCVCAQTNAREHERCWTLACGIHHAPRAGLGFLALRWRQPLRAHAALMH
eukprot:359240-Chlamydomonas_euryale.AAC.6